MDDQEKEREQFAQVFHLTGGELEDAPWKIDGSTFRYWCEGLPDYIEREYKDRFDDGIEYRTIIAWNSAPIVLNEVDGTSWRRVKSFLSSGEAECPSHGQVVGKEEWREFLNDPGDGAGEECALCSSPPGEEHGMIYIGDGFAEVVYRRESHAAYLRRVLAEVFRDAVDVQEIDSEVIEVEGIVYLSVHVEGTTKPLYSWGHVVSHAGNHEVSPSVDYDELGCLPERDRAVEGLCGLLTRARLARFLDIRAEALEEETT